MSSLEQAVMVGSKVTSLDNTQCPACHSSNLSYQLDSPSLQETYLDAIYCQDCHRHYDLIYGVPYLGTFYAEEILSLLEIAANTDRSRSLLSKHNGKLYTEGRNQDYLFWIDLIEEYTNSPDKPGLLKDKEIEKPYWLENRYREHLLFKTLTQTIQMNGKSVLDVGAGTGFDSLKFYACGAKVTCLEFSPLLCLRGKFDYPQLRWFGGSSRNLPFSNCQFDIVVANAALHHLSDIPTSLGECLRVLKPEGYLITMGDPFRSNQASEEMEALIFNDHVAVLQGVNEQVPKFSDFIETLEKYRDYLDIRVFTNVVHQLSPYPREWRFDDALGILSNAAGDIHFLIQKKNDFPTVEVYLEVGEVQPATYTSQLQNQSSGISWLVNFIPNPYFNLPLLDTQFPKFRLLNGWKVQKEGDDVRTAYKRARLFFRSESKTEQKIYISLLIPYVSQYDEPIVNVSINSEIVFSQSLSRGIWHHLEIPILSEKFPEWDIGEKFFLEIALHTDSTVDEANIFRVRRFELLSVSTALHENSQDFELDEFGLETLMSTVLKERKNLTVLVSPDYDHSIDIINRLNQFQCALKLIIPSEQRQFYSWIPGCHVASYYSHAKSVICNFENLGTINSVQLVISSDANFDAGLIKEVKEKIDDQFLYVIQRGGIGKFLYLNRDRDNQQKEFFSTRMDSSCSEAFPLAGSDTTDAKDTRLGKASNLDRSEHRKSLDKNHKQAKQTHQVKRLRKKLQHSHRRLNELERRIEQTETELEMLKTSKFWKVRSLWHRIKPW